jgi:hypothetical protein
MEDSDVSPELTRALRAAERPERLALGFLTVVALVGGVFLDGALDDAGYSRLGETVGRHSSRPISSHSCLS